MLFISQTLPYSFCACVRNTPKSVAFVIEKMKLVSFSLFLDAFPPRPKMPFTYVVNVYSDMSLSKGHFGQFENLVFVIMSTRENIRLIARSSFLKLDSNYRKSTCHCQTPKLCRKYWSNHELKSQLHGRAISCNVSDGLCLLGHQK